MTRRGQSSGRLPVTTPRRGTAANGLTARELEVLLLLAQGRSNDQIASLYMASKTASVHVSRILSKLGVANRTEAAAQARRLGLTDD